MPAIVEANILEEKVHKWKTEDNDWKHTQRSTTVHIILEFGYGQMFE